MWLKISQNTPDICPGYFYVDRTKYTLPAVWLVLRSVYSLRIGRERVPFLPFAAARYIRRTPTGLALWRTYRPQNFAVLLNPGACVLAIPAH